MLKTDENISQIVKTFKNTCIIKQKLFFSERAEKGCSSPQVLEEGPHS